MCSKFLVLDVSQPSDYRTWLEIWKSWPHRDIFAHPDYVRQFSQNDELAKCAYYQSAHGIILYPFIHRIIPSLLNVSGIWTDIVSPYGYGGCFAWKVSDPVKLGRDFYGEFDTWANRECVVSEFVRLSLFSQDRLEFPDRVRKRSLNVVRSLDIDEQEIWRDYEAKVRKNVMKAVRNNVHITVDESGGTVEEFHRVYDETMLRRDAKSDYRFSLDFFVRFNQLLDGHFVYFNAVRDSQVISTELVLVSSQSVYSFLGGTVSASFDVRPNDLLKHEVILWAKSRGKRHFVLGGGYQSEDGIFRYKKAFAPNGLVPFETGERIINTKTYESLVSHHLHNAQAPEGASHSPADFFPKYRT